MDILDRIKESNKMLEPENRFDDEMEKKLPTAEPKLVISSNTVVQEFAIGTIFTKNILETKNDNRLFYKIIAEPERGIYILKCLQTGETMTINHKDLNNEYYIVLK